MRVMRGLEGHTYVRLGAAIRRAREARAWSVDDLRSAIHERENKTIEEIEAGTARVTVYRLLAIAHALGVERLDGGQKLGEGDGRAGAAPRGRTEPILEAVRRAE